jgi:hypothetical protein
MATTRKQLAQAVGTTSAATLYTRSGEVSAQLRIVNTTDTDRYASVWNDDNGTDNTDAVAILSQAVVPARGVLVIGGIYMNTASGTIRILAEANTALTFTLYGTEKT